MQSPEDDAVVSLTRPGRRGRRSRSASSDESIRLWSHQRRASPRRRMLEYEMADHRDGTEVHCSVEIVAARTSSSDLER
jgi:hypothetical protein